MATNDSEEPPEGRGVFGEMGSGSDANPLEILLILGAAGTLPFDGRGDDRWVLAWARSCFRVGLIRVIEAEGGELQDAWSTEAFYEAKITDVFRIGVPTRAGLPRRAEL